MNLLSILTYIESVMMPSLTSLTWVIVSFFLISLARDLLISLTFSKNQLLVSLLFSIAFVFYFFNSHLDLYYFHFLSTLAFSLSLFFFLRAWCWSWDHWFEPFFPSKIGVYCYKFPFKYCFRGNPQIFICHFSFSCNSKYFQIFGDFPNIFLLFISKLIPFGQRT